MAFVIEDGVSYPHNTLIGKFGFKTERDVKDWIADRNVIYDIVGREWWIAGEDLRAAMRRNAMTHADRQQERSDKRQTKKT